MKTIAERLKELRQMQKIEQRELASVISVSRTAMSKYEKGDVIPSADKLIAIAQKYDVSMDWLCGLSDSTKSTQKIKTVSDFIKILPELENVGAVARVEVPIKIFDPDGDIMTVPSTSFLIEAIGDTLYHAIEEYEKINDLFKAEIIDKNIYDMSITGLLKKYEKCPIDDNELPF